MSGTYINALDVFHVHCTVNGHPVTLEQASELLGCRVWVGDEGTVTVVGRYTLPAALVRSLAMDAVAGIT